jgi:hypothetical protein
MYEYRNMMLMRKQDAKAYQEVFLFIKKECGSLTAALKFSGVSEYSYRKLFNDHEIRVYIAQKIMNARARLRVNSHAA